MPRQSPDRTPFASTTLTVHMTRGVLAAALIALAVYTHARSPWLATGAGVAAMVLLRGCPLCWTLGLLETMSKHPLVTRWRARI